MTDEAENVQVLPKRLTWADGTRVSGMPEDCTPEDYRNAPSGMGPLALIWGNTPHRLIYQAAGEVLKLKAQNADLLAALEELLVDMKIAQRNMRHAATKDARWEGCAEAVQPRVDAARAAIARATGDAR